MWMSGGEEGGRREERACEDEGGVGGDGRDIHIAQRRSSDHLSLSLLRHSAPSALCVYVSLSLSLSLPLCVRRASPHPLRCRGALHCCLPAGDQASARGSVQTMSALERHTRETQRGRDTDKERYKDINKDIYIYI